jgi:hypothetical protein
MRTSVALASRWSACTKERGKGAKVCNGRVTVCNERAASINQGGSIIHLPVQALRPRILLDLCLFYLLYLLALQRRAPASTCCRPDLNLRRMKHDETHRTPTTNPQSTTHEDYLGGALFAVARVHLSEAPGKEDRLDPLAAFASRCAVGVGSRETTDERLPELVACQLSWCVCMCVCVCVCVCELVACQFSW